MKKILTLIAIVTATVAFAQTDSTKSCCSKPKAVDLYIAGGISTSTGNNFNLGTYPGLEIGICRKNTMFGLAGGRGNLDFSVQDVKENYWMEVKSYAYKAIGDVNCYFVGGWGQYINTTHSFIEYGVGASYSIKHIALSVSVTNWDNVVYLSPGICYNFSVGKKK